jgi:hypothetical protein
VQYAELYQIIFRLLRFQVRLVLSFHFWMNHQDLRQDNQLPIDLIHLDQDHIARQMCDIQHHFLHKLMQLQF